MLTYMNERPLLGKCRSFIHAQSCVFAKAPRLERMSTIHIWFSEAPRSAIGQNASNLSRESLRFKVRSDIERRALGFRNQFHRRRLKGKAFHARNNPGMMLSEVAHGHGSRPMLNHGVISWEKALIFHPFAHYRVRRHFIYRLSHVRNISGRNVAVFSHRPAPLEVTVIPKPPIVDLFPIAASQQPSGCGG